MVRGDVGRELARPVRLAVREPRLADPPRYRGDELIYDFVGPNTRP